MEIELYCPCCSCGFGAPAEASEQEVVDRMIDEGPWYGLAKGETFEDMVRAALNDRGQILCPACRGEILIRGMESPLRMRELTPCG